MKTWLRWRIAELIDRLFPGACWADLAAWAGGYTKFRDIKFDGLCRRGGMYFDEKSGGCYCGKNRVEGIDDEG